MLRQNRLEQVVRLAGAFNDALRTGGVASCGKHFPGLFLGRNRSRITIAEDQSVSANSSGSNWRSSGDAQAALTAAMICHGYALFNEANARLFLYKKVVTSLLREDGIRRAHHDADDLDMGAIYNEYGRGNHYYDDDDLRNVLARRGPRV